jgi:hypothetical protein
MNAISENCVADRKTMTPVSRTNALQWSVPARAALAATAWRRASSCGSARQSASAATRPGSAIHPAPEGPSHAMSAPIAMGPSEKPALPPTAKIDTPVARRSPAA